MSNREPKDLCIACHNSDVNRASRSEMMEVGTPVPRNNFFKIDVCESGELTRFLYSQEVCRLGESIHDFPILYHSHPGI
ncbi:hypothetical protein Hanom_Chr09g00789671 [Helianthus anomalus]